VRPLWNGRRPWLKNRLYEVVIDDPTTWTRPWTAVIRLKHVQGSIYEFACHEGNLSMISILAGARAEEKAAGPR
jgi:hypothetical protein